MGADRSWLWNVNRSEEEARKILKDPRDPRFLHYASRRLATANVPKEVFRDYLSQKDFLERWPAIKRQMNKDSRNRDRVIFWQGAYEFLIRDLKAKGIPFVRPKAEVRADPERKQAGEELKARRRFRKMTQSELARETGLTQQHIAKIEKGLTAPRFRTLQKIRKALGIPAGEYTIDEGPVRAGKVSASVTTWLTPDPGARTESK